MIHQILTIYLLSKILDTKVKIENTKAKNVYFPFFGVNLINEKQLILILIKKYHFVLFK